MTIKTLMKVVMAWLFLSVCATMFEPYGRRPGEGYARQEAIWQAQWQELQRAQIQTHPLPATQPGCCPAWSPPVRPAVY